MTQVLENAAAALHCSWTARVDPTDALTRLLNIHVAHVEQLKDSRGASELTAACPEMTSLAGLVRSFAALLKPGPGN